MFKNTDQDQGGGEGGRNKGRGSMEVVCEYVIYKDDAPMVTVLDYYFLYRYRFIFFAIEQNVPY